MEVPPDVGADPSAHESTVRRYRSRMLTVVGEVEVRNPG